MLFRNLCFAYVRKVFPVFSAEHLLSRGVQESSFCLCTQGVSNLFSRASAQPCCSKFYVLLMYARFFQFFQPSICSAVVCKNVVFAYVRKVFSVFSAEHPLSHVVQKSSFAYVRKVFLVSSAEHLLSHGVQKFPLARRELSL